MDYAAPTRELVQRVDENGSTLWVNRHTGEVEHAPKEVRRPVAKDMLYELEPYLFEKLTQNKPMTWFEIGRCVDVLTRACTMESMKTMMGARTLHEMQRCLKTMLIARAACERMNPIGKNPDLSATRTDAQKTAKSMLTLPG